jgi:hypothetical protein
MKKLLNRFVDIWKLDFLAKFFAKEKEDNKTTLWFWLISNLVVALAVSVSFCWFLCTSGDDLIKIIDENVPDDASIVVTDGHLITENIEEPFFREITASESGSNYGGNFVVIIDTHSTAYDITSLDEYDSGIIVMGDRLYVKDDSEFNSVIFSEVPNFSLNKNEIITFVENYFVFPFSILVTIAVGLFMFVWFAGFRLISAFWWALLLFILILIFDIKESYITTYKAVLNLYFIPTLVLFLIGIIGLNMPMMTTLIFIAVFIGNLIWIKKHPQKEKKEDVLNKVPQINPTTVKQINKK